MTAISESHHVVVVGGGTASASAVRTLRRRGFDGSISLVCDEPHMPYQRPPLSKGYLSGQEDLDSLSLFDDRWLTDKDVELVSGTAVVRIDATSRRVLLSDGRRLEASQVVLATGGRPRRFPGAAPSDRVHYLRTLDDADSLRSAIRPGGHMVIVGGGYVGLEVASTVRRLGMEVTVFEAGPRPLAGVLPAELADAVCELHTRNGVRIGCGHPIESIEDRGTEVIVRTGNGGTVVGDAVVIGIGMIPNTGIAEESGLAVGNGVLADTAGRTSVPEILTAGDVAEWKVPTIGGTRRIEHFEIAGRQGAAVANTILGRASGAFDAPWFWSDQYDSNIQVVGTTADVDRIIYRGDPRTLEFSALMLAGSTLVGAFAMDRGEDIMGARVMVGLDVGSVVERLSDESTDLMDVADVMDEIEEAMV
ncbi:MULTISPECIES: NAD(P)/FAD-dependent oxidoreductase [unclassified Dietzia]|uniref:NAD(P)/FAD-dependent oxidoreductase n=1 Tax=unclassified Dietzia TaxID=2617939 RepID=UPI0015FA6D7B|nr:MULTISPECIES: FAD-dependent oxidoreductase [unclassified Dietzia]MBB1023248.1 FAD-dependent oxidoreductase [Dietzia sp. DQ12-76]MBB1028315.1 FAD-dependent oxidoreductase [Dietzia sp. DQ11-38-2]